MQSIVSGHHSPICVCLYICPSAVILSALSSVPPSSAARTSIRLSVHVCLFLHRSLRDSLCLTVCLSIRFSINQSFCFYACNSLHLSVRPVIRPSFSLSDFHSVPILLSTPPCLSLSLYLSFSLFLLPSVPLLPPLNRNYDVRSNNRELSQQLLLCPATVSTICAQPDPRTRDLVIKVEKADRTGRSGPRVPHPHPQLAPETCK